MDTFCFVNNFIRKQSNNVSNQNKIKTKTISIKSKQTFTKFNNLCELDEQLLFGMISF